MTRPVIFNQMTAYIGERLQQARQARSLSLEKVAKETYIRLQYLQAMEAGDLSKLPSKAQARGFLRAYAGYLGLDEEELLAGLDDRLPAIAEVAGDPVTTPSQTGPATTNEAESIFKLLGQDLRQQRELLGFSLEDVEQHTHLRIRYLKALEAGQLSELPSPVQGRGMLSNYAVFLGLDPDPVLLRFAEGLQARLDAQRITKSRTDQPKGTLLPTGLRRLLSGDLIFGGLLIISLVVFVIWGVIRITTMRAEEAAEPTAPSIVQVILPSPFPSPIVPESTPTNTPVSNSADQPGEIQATDEPTLPEIGPGAVQVYVVVRQRAWMRVLVDGQIEFEGRVVPGSAYPFVGDETVEVLTGNGAGLHVNFNQQELGALGIMGEVVNRIFSVDGIITPTPSITPTITETPPLTPTLTPNPLQTPGLNTSPSPGSS